MEDPYRTHTFQLVRKQSSDLENIHQTSGTDDYENEIYIYI